MNSIELLEKIKLEDGVDAAFNKHRYLLSNMHHIIVVLEQGKEVGCGLSLEEAKKTLSSLMKWKVENNKLRKIATV